MEIETELENSFLHLLNAFEQGNVDPIFDIISWVYKNKQNQTLMNQFTKLKIEFENPSDASGRKEQELKNDESELQPRLAEGDNLETSTTKQQDSCDEITEQFNKLLVDDGLGKLTEDIAGLKVEESITEQPRSETTEESDEKQKETNTDIGNSTSFEERKNNEKDNGLEAIYNSLPDLLAKFQEEKKSENSTGQQWNHPTSYTTTLNSNFQYTHFHPTNERVSPRYQQETWDVLDALYNGELAYQHYNWYIEVGRFVVDIYQNKDKFEKGKFYCAIKINGYPLQNFKGKFKKSSLNKVISQYNFRDKLDEYIYNN